MGDKRQGGCHPQQPSRNLMEGAQNHTIRLFGKAVTSRPACLQLCQMGQGGCGNIFSTPHFFACPLFATQSSNWQTPPVRFVYVLDIYSTTEVLALSKSCYQQGSEEEHCPGSAKTMGIGHTANYGRRCNRR